MTTLEVQARISAVDNLTGHLHKIAGQVAAIGTQFQAAGKQVAGFSASALTAAAAPLTGMAFIASANQQELDKQLRLFQAFGDATVQQRENLRKLVNEMAPRIGASHAETIKGATEMIQAGLSPADLMTELAGRGGQTLLERITAGANAADTSVTKLANDLVQLAYIGKMPFGTGGERAATLEKLLGLGMAAPAFSPDKPGEHVAALRQFAPLLVPMLAGQNPTPEAAYDAMLQASALQNTLANMFKGSLGGMGLKTLLQRTMTPTMASEINMVQSGFDFGRVFGADYSKLRDVDLLMQNWKLAGLDMSAHKGDVAAFLAEMERNPANDYVKQKAELLNMLMPSMKGATSWDKRALKVGIDNFFALAQGKFNIEAWLEELSKLPPSALKDFGGLHHAPKAAGLQGDQAINRFREIMSQLPKRAATAADDMVATRNAPDSWDFQLRRMFGDQSGPGGVIQSLKNNMWDSGTGALMTSGLAKLNDALERLSKMDPAFLKALSTSLTVLGGAALGITALGGAVWAFGGALSALAANPAVLAIAAAGGISAWVLGQGLASNEGLSALNEMARLLSNLGAAAGDAATALGKFFGMFGLGNLEESPLRRMLKEDAETLNKLNSWIERMRHGTGQLDKADEPPAGGPTMTERFREREQGTLDWLKGLMPQWLHSMPEKGGGLSDMGSSGPQSAIDPAAISGPIVNRLSSPLAVTLTEQVKAQLEGHATVTVKVEGPGKVTGQSATGHLKVGDSMQDTNR